MRFKILTEGASPEIWYRGYDATYNPKSSPASYLWLTLDYNYAKDYADYKHGKVAAFTLTTDDIGSLYDLEAIEENTDYLDPGDDLMSELYDNGIFGYYFDANDYESECVCIKKTKVKLVNAEVKE